MYKPEGTLVSRLISTATDLCNHDIYSLHSTKVKCFFFCFRSDQEAEVSTCAFPIPVTGKQSQLSGQQGFPMGRRGGGGGRIGTCLVTRVSSKGRGAESPGLPHLE